MDTERALISKALQAGQLEKLVSMGVQEDHFADPEVRRVFELATHHMRKYSAPPSMDAVRKAIDEDHELDAFAFDVPTDSLEYLGSEFIKQVKRRATIEALRDLAKIVDERPDLHGDLDALVLEKARDLSRLVPSTRVALVSEARRRIAAYHDMVAEGTPPGIKMGIPAFDYLTNGIRRHEYVTIAGWQGTGKSTLMLHIFFQMYLQGKTPMIVSLEMESEALLTKIDVMATQIRSHAIEALELGEGDLQKWEQWAERAENATNEIIVLDDVGRCTVDKVYAETVRYNPDIVGVDYVSLMDAPHFKQTWEKVTFLTRELKMQARGLKIPLVAIAQTNIDSAGDGARLENIAYSRSIGQDSDLVMGLQQDDAMRAMEKMEVRLLKNRRGQPGTTWMLWRPDVGYFREWTPADSFEREKKEKQNDANGH